MTLSYANCFIAPSMSSLYISLRIYFSFLLMVERLSKYDELLIVSITDSEVRLVTS